jgi:Tfp pilus assembly PilM family ATPase
MFISAYGIMLLFTSNQAAVLITAPYPPFGLVTISFMGLSSYLILVGVYSSAISVAQDVNLRKSIRKTVEQHSNLLDNIGTSQMEQEIHRRVIKITKEKLNEMTEETGVQSSVTEDEMKQYMDNVLKEIKKA